MISKIVLTGLLAMFLSGGIYTKVTNEIDETATSSTAKAIENVQDDITKAIWYNGEVIPMIELPVVEITGVRNNDNLVDATIVGGHVYPLFELSEIVVTPGS